ncbi:hypothetical protein DPMN_018760 [Dreissena polymorpha]|uniref:Uncharacterized protein n=1 Tax=Dreissena polymorpha TaxID=45954 RepID=A0A9D4NDT0_DREPO|nr:hypothetical protein DPMN_018760 [Dreissena polymorpha]
MLPVQPAARALPLTAVVVAAVVVVVVAAAGPLLPGFYPEVLVGCLFPLSGVPPVTDRTVMFWENWA